MWFNRVNDTEINLSNKQITFNEMPDFQQLSEYPRRRLHLFVILLEEYVYSCKCLEKKTDQERIPNKNVDVMANREMWSLLILFLPPVKLILQKGGKDSKRYIYNCT